jgi:hypothetical protein
MENSSNILYTWNYEDNKDRSPLWYIIALSISIGLIIWGFLTQQYGMSIVVMLVVWFFYFLENNSEDEVKVELTDLWIKVQWNFYDYSRIWGYSIVYHGERALYLRLIIKKRGIWILNLNIDNSIVSNLRSILPNYIEENEKQDITLSERIIHLLKL